MSYTTVTIPIEALPLQEADHFLRSDPHTLLYASVPYLRLLKAFLECELEVITVRSGSRLVGYMPLAFRHAAPGTVCNSLPFYGSNGGMIVAPGEDTDVIRGLLLEAFNRLVSAKKCIASTVISNPLDKEGDAWLRANLSYQLTDERIGQITHFPQPDGDLEKALMASFEDPRPRNIRKAQKENIKVSVSNTPEALAFLYQTHYDNITAINGIAKEKRFFDMIPNFFNDDEYKIYIAEHEGKMVAALLLFFYNQTVEYFTPAVVEAYRGVQPTALIIYQAMLDAARLGYKNWNWGGTWLSQGGVYDFKKKWGTTDHNYFYYTNIIDESVRHMTRAELLSEFPYFFVLPFSALHDDQKK